jgi:hypothetical protein
MALPEVNFHEDDGPVGQGGSGSRYVTATDGSKWVVKSTYFGGQPHRYLYLNEALGALIAQALGAPVPRIAVMKLTLAQAQVFKPAALDSDRFLFACERMDPCEALSPEAVDGADLGSLAAITALDQLIWNTDRHGKPEHVLARKRPYEDSWDLWAVDHGHSFSVRDSLDAGDIAADRVAQAPWEWLTRRLSRGDLDPFIEKSRSISAENYKMMVAELPGAWIVEADTADRLAAALPLRGEALEGVLYPYV